MVQSLSKAAVCKLFPTTQKGPAAIWYQSLKEGSIRSFNELARAFRTHFAPSIQHKKKSSDLKLCYQKPRESLQSYIGRFNAEAVEVGNLNDDTMIDAMKDNTTMMAFRDNLITNPMRNTREKPPRRQAMFRHQGRLSTTPPARQVRPEGTATTTATSDGTTSTGEVRRSSLHPAQHSPIAYLNMDTNNIERVRYPPKMQYEGDKQKYCQFHDGHGHITDECGSLKKEIDRLVQIGRLKYFVAQNKTFTPGRNNPTNQNTRRESGPPPKRQNFAGVINTIAGRITNPEYKQGQKKRQKLVMHIATTEVLPDVSVTSEDGEGIDFPHQDPIVISSLIENFGVMRQLIYEGSSVNLITKEAYLGIGCSVLNLKKVSTPLVGLGGSPVQAEGVAELTVELRQDNGNPLGGLTGLTAKLKTLFMVVDMPLAYNVILGRPMLYATGAVTCI
ncbi:uncharacterized protein LOC126656936 [Mercurialis annua]|uniref:uncharacterized protein LOC126656936 n=1 Tax=Mercurialis annua TaxID=3986 RepID=UPI00215FFDAB|nr:uncharacterized protein LOC126656936 [Mercurialis annua]